MSCPTCDHTMECLTVGYFWCPRCGTVKSDSGVVDYVPKLVPRVRTLVDLVNDVDYRDDVLSDMVRIGVIKSVYLPDDCPIVPNS